MTPQACRVNRYGTKRNWVVRGFSKGGEDNLGLGAAFQKVQPQTPLKRFNAGALSRARCH